MTVTVLIAVATLGNTAAHMPSKGGSLYVSLVDGTTGDILWSDVFTIQGDFEGEALYKLVDRSFKQFPVEELE